MSRQPPSFGQIVRERRIEKGFSLRKFASLVGVSPTYVSQVEQGNVDAPTAERVKRMAELLEADSDEWTALAGRVPDDLSEIIQESPVEVAGLLRLVRGMSADQIAKLKRSAQRIKKQGG